MPDLEKIRAAILDERKDYGHRFADVVRFLQATGWKMRIKGSHHLFAKSGYLYILNLQPKPDGKAKAYQIRQVRKAISKG